MFFFGRVACGILVLQTGIEPMPPAVEARSLNHWTAREVLYSFFYEPKSLSYTFPLPPLHHSQFGALTLTEYVYFISYECYYRYLKLTLFSLLFS